MRKVYIGFSTPQKPYKLFSLLIRLYERTPYSHVYLRFPWIGGKTDLIYQASGTAVNFVGRDIFYASNKIIKEYELEVTDDAWLSALVWAANNAGKPYSLRQIFGIIIFNLQKRLGFKHPKNPFSDGRYAYVCSELVASLLIDCFDIPLDQSFLDTLTPKDIDLFLKSYLKNT